MQYGHYNMVRAIKVNLWHLVISTTAKAWVRISMFDEKWERQVEISKVKALNPVVSVVCTGQSTGGSVCNQLRAYQTVFKC